MKLLSFLFLYAIAQGALRECQQEWEIAFESQKVPDTTSKYSKMIDYSGFEIDNFGNYKECLLTPDLQYTVIRLTETPTKLLTLCSPKICEVEDYYEILKSNSSQYQISKVIHYQAEKFRNLAPLVWISREFNDIYSDIPTILLVIFITSIILIAVYATIKDYQLPSQEKPSTFLKYLLCFSLLRNLKMLLRSRSRDKLGQKDSLELLNGLRVLGSSWVILYHTIRYIWVGGVVSNTKQFAGNVTPKTMLIVSALFAVDLFFWITGFLTTYLLLNEIQRSTKFDWKMVYVHRILRYLPLVIFMMWFVMSLYKYMGEGPLWSLGELTFEGCKDVWWTHILFISNFYPNGWGNYCAGPSWSITVDMQLFLLTIPIIYVYTKNRKIGWLCLISYVLISIVSSGYLTYEFDINAVNAAHGNHDKWSYFYYNKPYTRIAPYAIGALTAFVVFAYRKNKQNGSCYDSFALSIAKSVENSFWRYTIGLIGLLLSAFTLMGLYDSYRFPGENNEYTYWSKWQNVAWVALAKPLYGLALTCIFLPAFLGHFRFLTKILSLDFWAPLERLTFPVYMVHYLVMLYYYRQQTEPYLLGEKTINANFLTFTIISYIVAIPLATLIEMPFNSLEKTYFTKETPQALTNKKTE